MIMKNHKKEKREQLAEKASQEGGEKVLDQGKSIGSLTLPESNAPHNAQMA